MIHVGINSILVLVCLINESFGNQTPDRLGAEGFGISEEYGPGIYPYDGAGDHKHASANETPVTDDMPIVLYPDALKHLQGQAKSYRTEVKTDPYSDGYESSDNAFSPKSSDQAKSTNGGNAQWKNGYVDTVVRRTTPSPSQQWGNGSFGISPGAFQYSGNGGIPLNILPTPPTPVNIPDELLQGNPKFTNGVTVQSVYPNGLPGGSPLTDAFIIAPVNATAAGTAQPGRKSPAPVNGFQQPLMNTDGTYNQLYNYTTTNNGKVFPVATGSPGATYSPYEQPSYPRNNATANPITNGNNGSIGINLRGPSKPVDGAHVHLTLKCENCEIDGLGDELSRGTSQHAGENLGGNDTQNKGRDNSNDLDENKHHNHHRHNHHHHRHGPTTDEVEEGAQYIPPTPEDLKADDNSDNGATPSDDSEKSVEKTTEDVLPEETKEAPPEPPRGQKRKGKGLFNFVKRLENRKQTSNDDAENTKSELNDSTPNTEDEASFLEMGSSGNTTASAGDANPSKVDVTLHAPDNDELNSFTPDSSLAGEIIPDYTFYDEHDNKPLTFLAAADSTVVPNDVLPPTISGNFASFLDVSPKEGKAVSGNIFTRAIEAIRSTFKKWFAPKAVAPSTANKTTEADNTSIGSKIGSFFRMLGAKIRGFFIKSNDKPSLLEKSSTTSPTKPNKGRLIDLRRAFAKLMERIRRKYKKPVGPDVEAAPLKLDTKKYFRSMEKYDKQLHKRTHPSFIDGSSALSDDETTYYHHNPSELGSTKNDMKSSDTDSRDENEMETAYITIHDLDDDLYEALNRFEALEATAARDGTDKRSSENRAGASADANDDKGTTGMSDDEDNVVESSNNHVHNDEGSNEEMAEQDEPHVEPSVVSKEYASFGAPPNKNGLGDGKNSIDGEQNKDETSPKGLRKSRRTAFLKFVDRICGIVEKLFRPETTPLAAEAHDHAHSANNITTTGEVSKSTPVGSNTDRHLPLPDADAYAGTVKTMHLADDLNTSVHDLVDGDLGKLLNGSKKQVQHLLYYAPLSDDEVVMKGKQSPVDEIVEPQMPSSVTNETDPRSIQEIDEPKTSVMEPTATKSAAMNPLPYSLPEESQDDIPDTSDAPANMNGSLRGKRVVKPEKATMVTPLTTRDDVLDMGTESNDGMDTTPMRSPTRVRPAAVLAIKETLDMRPENDLENTYVTGEAVDSERNATNSRAGDVSNVTKAVKLESGIHASESSQPSFDSFEAAPSRKGTKSSSEDEESTSWESDYNLSDLMRQIASDEIKKHMDMNDDHKYDRDRPLERLVHRENVFDIEDTVGKGRVKMHLQNLLRKFTDAHEDNNV